MDKPDFAWLGGRLGEGYRLSEPPSTDRVVEVEVALDTRFPPQLRALYTETDGVYAMAGEWYFIWPLETLLIENLRAFARGPTPRKEYLGFGDDGTGDPYCVRRDGGDAVYSFDNILAEVTPLADSLISFLGGSTA